MSELKVRGSPERKVLGELGNMKTEPISPTANLRLLVTLASNLKNASDHTNQLKTIQNSFDVSQNSNSDLFKLLPRKEKSLGLLCNKFLSLYPLVKLDSIPQEISLDGTAKALGTEKRRIYDIINVLESLEMASKAGKNRYLWHGQNGLSTTLAKLKSLAIKLGLREQIQEIQKTNRAYTGEFFDNSSSPLSTLLVSQSPSLDVSFSDTGIKEDKSLGVMCQKFIMLFLISLKNGVINLDIAAKVLITDSDQTTDITDTNLRSRFKTKVRRLYDIANVLTAIGLIRKVNMCDSVIRKPVFKYMGPDVDCVDFDAETLIRESTRHSLIGMLTPSGSCTRTLIPRFSANKLPSTPNRLFSVSADSPMNKRRKLRKRKLFKSDDIFGRTHSSPNLNISSRPSERLDDSILQVAEMELKKLKSSEELEGTVYGKLFPRHNSDSCITATQVSGEFSNYVNKPNSREFIESRESDFDSFSLLGAEVINDQSRMSSTNEPFTIVSKENLVRGNMCNVRSPYQITDKIPLRMNISRPDLQIPTIKLSTANSNLRNVQIKNDANAKLLKLKIQDHNIPVVKSIAPKKLLVRDFKVDNNVVKFAPYKIPAKSTMPKFVNLTNFDTKKLVPVKPSDLNISVTTLQPSINKNTNLASTRFAIITQVPTQALSPGDMFKAVKIGNTLQLVPVCNGNAENLNHESNTSKNGS